MTDIRLPIAETIFALRVGIICVQHGKLLVVTGNHLKFKYSIGGAVNIGEETAAAAAREWQEETGLEAGPLRLVGVVENFFELNGQRWHEVGFYYEMTWHGPPITVSRVADQPHEYLEWLPLEKLAEERVYPEAINELLNVPAGEIRHLVNREVKVKTEHDLRFILTDTEFQVRVHLIYVQEGSLLTNTVPDSNFWFLPGGSVKVGEDTLAAAVREWREETGTRARSARLIALSEGFDAGKRRQQIGFFYLVHSDQPLPAQLYPVLDHDRLILEWVSIDEIAAKPVRPQWISTLLQLPEGEIRHSIIHLTSLKPDSSSQT